MFLLYLKTTSKSKVPSSELGFCLCNFPTTYYVRMMVMQHPALVLLWKREMRLLFHFRQVFVLSFIYSLLSRFEWHCAVFFFVSLADEIIDSTHDGKVHWTGARSTYLSLLLTVHSKVSRLRCDQSASTFVLHKACESHFVNRSDVWLSSFELMSDEVLGSRTRHLFVFTWSQR